jgi:hypothetical protein
MDEEELDDEVEVKTMIKRICCSPSKEKTSSATSQILLPL